MNIGIAKEQCEGYPSSDGEQHLENALPTWDSGVDDPAKALYIFVPAKPSVSSVFLFTPQRQATEESASTSGPLCLSAQAVWNSRLYSDIITAQFNGDTATCRPEHPGHRPKPLHLHKSASSRTYRYGDISQSCIYRVHYEEFRSMIKEEPETIQAIFSERHILVYGCNTDRQWSWCSRSLQRLGPLRQPIQVQGPSLGYHDGIMRLLK